jgi:hypothetical protein
MLLEHGALLYLARRGTQTSAQTYAAQMLTVGEDGLSKTGGKLFGVGLDV